MLSLYRQTFNVRPFNSFCCMNTEPIIISSNNNDELRSVYDYFRNKRMKEVIHIEPKTKGLKSVIYIEKKDNENDLD